MVQPTTHVSWGLPEPFHQVLEVSDGDVDRLGHVNNAVYLQWCERIAWAHSEAIGLGWETWHALDRAMAVHALRLAYHAPALAGDRVAVGNWIVRNDGRLRATRRFEIHRVGDRLLLSGEIDYVCIQISNGRPRRLPPEFTRAYPVLPAVEKALAEAP